jgi:hypothetical protein
VAPTPAPEDSYDPKVLSASSAGTPTPTPTPNTLRKTPSIVKASSIASSKATRPAPAIAKATPAASSNPTVETPKLVIDELSARLALRTPAPPADAPALASESTQASGSKGLYWLLAAALLAGAVIVGVIVLGGGDSTEEDARAQEPALVEPKDDSVGNLIKKADEQFIAGRLVGDGGALSLLVAARVASPEDERVALRLGPLADKFQELGESAQKAGDIVEAAAHFKNSLEADPGRQAVRTQLAAIDAEIKAAEENKK